MPDGPRRDAPDGRPDETSGGVSMAAFITGMYGSRFSKNSVLHAACSDCSRTCRPHRYDSSELRGQ
jgi:hypothetical protein